MQLVRVKVLLADIENGWKANAFSCPIALACQRAGIPGPVVEDDSMFSEINRWDTITLPTEARQFIKQFDAGSEECLPFEFMLTFVEREGGDDD